MFSIIIHFILNIIKKTTWKKVTKLKSLLKQYDPNTVKSLIESIWSSVYLLGLLPRVSGPEMRGFQETNKSPHVRQPCAAEVNEY